MVLAVTGILLGTTVAIGVPLLDALAVETATQEVTDLIALARDEALATQARTAVHFDQAARRITVHRATDTLAVTVLAAGLRLQTSRDSLAYSGSGLGAGAANLRIIISGARSADTIAVSRLGRVSRS